MYIKILTMSAEMGQNQLKELYDAAESVVVITGAGISAEIVQVFDF